MKKIIFASSNDHKISEVRRILDFYDILSLKDIGFKEEIVEDGYSFEDNATIKAEAVQKFTKGTKYENYAILADDSGLCVKAINYEPGIMSSRYSGGGDEENRKLLLSKLATIQDRTAYFQCFMVLLLSTGEKYVVDGKTYGLISKTKIGDERFGYDCLFWSDKLRKTFGQATPEEKDSVSHRAIALKKVKEILEEIDYLDIVDDDELQ